MKSQKYTTTSKVLWLLICSAWLMIPVQSFAQTVIGSWQNETGDGWIDWATGDSITNPAINPSIYSFADGVVSNYTQSLQISEAGYNQNLAIKLEYLPGGIAAFLTNYLLTFTFSVPAAASSGSTAGYSQLYALAINASGYGFNNVSTNLFTATGSTNNNIGWQPNFNFYSGAPARSQVVTVNYSNILSQITATPTNGYIELIFSFNNGNGAPTNYFINNVTLSGGSGTVITNPPPPPTTNGTVIGSWQGTGSALTNSLDEGWIDWPTGDSITNPAVDPSIYSFVSNAVSGYGQSLQIAESGNNQNLAIKLEYLPGGVAAFLTNHLLSFTFSVPSAASSGSTAGYSQLYALAINASGIGFSNQSFANFTATGNTNNNYPSGQPNFYFYSGSPVQSQTVTLNYSNLLSSITATPSSGYIELVFSFNNGGGAATNYFINNVTLSGGSGIVITNPPPPPPTTNGVVIGSWQGTGSALTNTLDEGWIDWPTLDSITNPAVYPGIYSFVSGAVSGYGQSLQIAESGNNQNLAIKLEYLPGGVAAFLTNHLLSFTFSVPSAASSGSTAGYSQLYALAINASGYGFVNQSSNEFSSTGFTTNNNGWQPNFNFYTGAPARSQVVTVDYSNILSQITATPTNGYIELIFDFNNGGGAPTNYFINNVTLSGGPVAIVTNPPPPPSVVIGSWQGTGSALTNTVDEGWIDWPTLDSITNPAVYPSIYSFVSGAVSGYGQSLQINESGYHQNLAIKLENLPGGMAAFLTNHLLNFTFSVPGTTGNAGFSQLYALSINANGYGFVDQAATNFSATGATNNNSAGHNGLPNFYFSNNGPAQSQVVTLNYSNILSALAVSNTASSGYIEIIFAFNNGSGGPANYFINNVNLSGGSGIVVTNPPPSSTNLFTFNLLNGPTNSSLNSSNGVFTWRPLVSQAKTTNLVTVSVTENSAPNLSATNSYNVIVNPLTPSVISAITVSGGQSSLTINGPQGPDYTVLTATNLLGGWQSLFTTNSPVLPLTLVIPASATNPVEFYRIQIGP
jgi:hypothetical protein